MPFEEFIIATLAIIFGTGLTAYIFAKIFGLVRMWLEGRSGGGVSREEYNRLGKAFLQQKKEVETRLQNLETIVTDEEQSPGKLNQPAKTIEVENRDEDEERTSSGDSNLKNMLRG